MADARIDDRPLGVGVIGAGGVSRLHSLALCALPELARPVAVADLDAGRREQTRQLYGFDATYENYKDLLARDDVDVVSICTRPSTHARIVTDALEAGKHVLCEKPIAHTLAQADEIAAACARHPQQRVSFVYQWRLDPAIRRLVRLAEAGHLGLVVAADVQLRTRRSDHYYEPAARRESWDLDGGGVLAVVAIHQLDVLIQTLGEPAEVSGRMATFLKPTEGEDTLVAWIRFRSGALVTFSCTVCSFQDDFSIEVFGEKASVHLRGGPQGLPPCAHACSWQLAARDRAARRRIDSIGLRESPAPPRDPSFVSTQLRSRWARFRGRPWLPPLHWWHTPALRQFLESLRQGEPAPIPAADARRSLELAAALYESALHERIVKLPVAASSPIYAGVHGVELREVGGA
jgi:predicted dehydrogenase